MQRRCDDGKPVSGPESLAPFFIEAEKAQRGVVVLVRNSNADSSVYQSLITEAGPLFAVVAASLAKWQDRLAGRATEWSSLGVTVAATHAGDTERIRTALPRALFLVLGYGAQGASAGEAVRVLQKGLQGNIFTEQRDKDKNTRLLAAARQPVTCFT